MNGKTIRPLKLFLLILMLGIFLYLPFFLLIPHPKLTLKACEYVKPSFTAALAVERNNMLSTAGNDHMEAPVKKDERPPPVSFFYPSLNVTRLRVTH